MEQYRGHLRKYLRFLRIFGLPWIWGPPALLDRVRNIFAMYLGLAYTPQRRTVDGRLTMAYVEGVISGVNKFLRALSAGRVGFPEASFGWQSVKRLLRKRLRSGGSTNNIVPLTSRLMRRVLAAARDAYDRAGPGADARTFLHAAVIIYFFSMRIGEGTWGTATQRGAKPRRFDSNRDVRLVDAVFNTRAGGLVLHNELRTRHQEVHWLLLRFRGWKGVFNVRRTMARARSGHDWFCPVRVAIVHVLESRARGVPDHAPLFVEAGSLETPYTRGSFVRRLKAAAKDAGLDTAGISGYSPRKGAVSSMAGYDGMLAGGAQLASSEMLRHKKVDRRLLAIYAKKSSYALERLSMVLAFSEARGFSVGDRATGDLLCNPEENDQGGNRKRRRQ